MIRILHLSDLHFSKSSLKDIKMFIYNALIKDLQSFHKEKLIDIIAITGDLIDMGGISFNSGTDEAFQSFLDDLLNPLLTELNIAKEHVFFTPGNHDIFRKADEKFEDVGLKNSLVSTEELNKFMDKNIAKGINRILPFKKFEKDFRKDFTQKIAISNFESTYSIIIGEMKIGINCLNSAWRCFDADDKDKLLLGERQITNARQIIENCELKICLVHHPIDWMAEFDRKNVFPFLVRDYNVLLCGHVHQGEAWANSNMHGTLLVSSAPANWYFGIRSKDREFSNGYSIVDFDETDRKIFIHNRRYVHSKEMYVKNTDIGDDDGTYRFDLPGLVDRKKIDKELMITDVVKKSSIQSLNENLLNYHTNSSAPKDINQIFVNPRIAEKKESEDNEEKEVEIQLESLIRDEGDIIIFGTKESGKTILLNKLLIDFTDRISVYHKIGIFIDFNDIGNKRFETIIIKFLGINISEFPRFLTEYNTVLLVDNLNFNQENLRRLKRLEKFKGDYPNCRIIATSFTLLENSIPLEYIKIDPAISFKVYQLRSFKTRHTKELIEKWFSCSDELDTPEKCKKILSVLLSLKLPRTPLAISMFLLIIEHQEDYKPLNHATMLENFIEKVFEKASKSEVLSEKFDYKNKERLLADIAYYMFSEDKENYRVHYYRLNTFIHDYLQRKKFEFQSEKLLTHFLEKGILITESNETDNYVSFRFNCFFQYFLMKKMEFDSKFRDFVLSEENILKFYNEVDYYTGINRDKTFVLKSLIKYMELKYNDIMKKINDLKNTYDTAFITKSSFASTLDDNFTQSLFEAPKPKEEEIDYITDEILENSKPEKGIQKKLPQLSHTQILERLWALSARVLRNTEETEEEHLKSKSYQKVLKCSLAYAFIYKIYLDNYLDEIAGKEALSANLVITNSVLPLLHQIILHNLLGTGKLSVIIREKIEADLKDDQISELEKYMSIFIYADIGGHKFEKYIKEFVKSIKLHCIYDVTLFKLISYYFLRSKGKESDLYYENLIAETIVRSKGLKKVRKGRIMEDYRKKKTEHKKEEEETDDN